MRVPCLIVTLVLPVLTSASELDVLPLGEPEAAYELGSAGAGEFYDAEEGTMVDLETMAERMASADVVLLGEEHTAMDQKILHADLLDAMAESGRTLVLAMEFFQRGDRDALDRWIAGETDERQLLEETGWYDRGGYRWEYYRPVMEVARSHGIPVVGVNVPREIPRAVNRGGLDGLSDEQRAEVGEITTDGSPQHRYLISRYFGDTVAMLPPGWFENMYAAQCLWDVVMARSILDVAVEDATVVLIVGSGHIAYGLGIPRRLADEREAAGEPPIDVVTLCPATAPAPPDDGEPTGHPMGGGGHGMGSPGGSPAQFARSLADYVAVFADRGGVEAFPTIGMKLKADDDEKPVVSIVFPDTLASTVGFASGDRILDINGVEPVDLGEFRFLLAGIEWGQRLGIQVMRGEETVEIAALLFPGVEAIDRTVAPGFEVEALDAFDPESAIAASAAAVPADRAGWRLVTEDGAAVRVDVRIDDVLEEAHELDEDGRVARSLYRIARDDGAVEVRYERDESGAVVKTASFDRTGAAID
jgi:uncharacterized iron-regulated protein